MNVLASGAEERFPLWQDVRRGEAGLVARLALSLVAALALAAVAVLVLGLIDVVCGQIPLTGGTAGGYVYYRSTIRDEHIAIAMGLAGLLWFIALIKLWATYRRFRHVLKTTFGILAIWVVTIPLCVVTDVALRRGEEFLITASILAALGGSILLATMTVYRMRRGKALFTAEGRVNLNCPSCGYCMVGLEQSRCPECGNRYTLDELVAKQGFAGLDACEADHHPPLETELPSSIGPACETVAAPQQR